jgi:Septum formation
MKNWAIYIAAALGFAIYGAVTDADRDGSGAIVGEGTVDAFNVRVGDCFNDSESLSEQIFSVAGVPCSVPHDNETFAVIELALEGYTDEDTMFELAHESCRAQFESFVGRDYESSTLEITTMYPTSASWAQNDREVVCAVYDMDANKLVGSAAGSGL